ncbi:hypothetical protein [Streptomyces sp. LN785]|uniref:hypothetical protein n=1 Tax=Streptomyces sp. LN785 TaxID=3112983 RepID=UPI003718DDAB
MTIFQAAPGLPRQPIAAGRYRDRFVQRDGVWRFAERRLSRAPVTNPAEDVTTGVRDVEEGPALVRVCTSKL